MLEEQLRRKFAEQKEQIAQKIKEVDEAKAKIEEHMERKKRGVFDFGTFDRSAADVLKSQVAYESSSDMVTVDYETEKSVEKDEETKDHHCHDHHPL